MHDKNLQKGRKKYDASFKAEVVNMITSGHAMPDIARSLGIGENLIYWWRREALGSTQNCRIDTNCSACAGQPFRTPGVAEAAPGGGDGAGYFKKSYGYLLTASVKERCRFINEKQTTYLVNMLCKAMHVSRSSFYQYLTPNEHNAQTQQVEEKITAIFRVHKWSYGVRRICAQLKEEQIRVGKYKCIAILKQQGLMAIQPCSFVPRTNQSRHRYPISTNLLLDR